MHNVLNATAAIAVGTALDVPADQIRSGARQLSAVSTAASSSTARPRGVSVIDDYGHHPTEIRATLAAARQCGFRRVHVIFQPHRYTRTRDLMDEFATAFADADSLFLLDIYAASEKPIEGVTAETPRPPDCRKRAVAKPSHIPSFVDATTAVAALAQPGDMILTLGAGNVSQLGPMILERLEKQSLVAGR